MTSIITHEIEERYPYPDNGERPVTQTRSESRSRYGVGDEKSHDRDRYGSSPPANCTPVHAEICLVSCGRT